MDSARERLQSQKLELELQAQQELQAQIDKMQLALTAAQDKLAAALEEEKQTEVIYFQSSGCLLFRLLVCCVLINLCSDWV